MAAPLFLSSTALLVKAGMSLQYRTLILGLLLGAGPVVQFFIAPLMGAYADRIGRKPILVLSVMMNAVAHALFGVGILTQQLWLLFISRALSGVGSANLAAANSAVADISAPDEKVRNFGLVGMALGVGFIFGPFLGGVFSNATLAWWFNLATPLWIASALSVLNVALVLIFFRETLRVRVSGRVTMFTGFRNIAKAFTMPNLRAMYLVSFLFGFGFNFFAQFFSVFLIARFQFGSSQIGSLFAYLGIWMAFGQGILARYLSRAVSARTVVRWSLILLVATLLVLAGVRRISAVYVLLPLVAVTYGVAPPNLTAIISNLADHESQGEALGIDRAMSALSFGLPPILSGWAVGLNVGMPMLFAAVFIFIAWAVFVRAHLRAPRPIFHEIS